MMMMMMTKGKLGVNLGEGGLHAQAASANLPLCTICWPLCPEQHFCSFSTGLLSCSLKTDQITRRPDKMWHHIIDSVWIMLDFCGCLILFSLNCYSLLCFSHGNFISQLFKEQLCESAEDYYFFFPFTALCAGTSLKPESELSLTWFGVCAAHNPEHEWE